MYAEDCAAKPAAKADATEELNALSAAWKPEVKAEPLEVKADALDPDRLLIAACKVASAAWKAVVTSDFKLALAV